ncbi:MAG TPA: LysE family transporter [Kofleriaceae bacterium]
MFILTGVAAGALTGVPIGPVNVAVIDAAYRHTLRRAIAVGLGGACADFLYAALGILGVTPVLRSYAIVSPILYAVSGIVLLVYGFLTARSQPVTPTHHDALVPAVPENELVLGFKTGLLLILLNPAAVVTWVVITEQIADHLGSPSTLTGLLCAVGVMGGSFAWFALVAHLTQRGKNVLGDKAAWIPRVIGVALMVYAVYLIARAVKYAVT